MNNASPSTSSALGSGERRPGGESSDAKADVRQSYDALRKDVADLTSSLKELSKENLQKAGSAAEKGISKFEKTVRANPTQSAVVAAGVGFLIGLMMTR